MTTPTSRRLPLALACSLLCTAATPIAAQQRQAEQSTQQSDSRRTDSRRTDSQSGDWQRADSQAADSQEVAAGVFRAVPMQPVFATEASSSDSNGNSLRSVTDGSPEIEAMRRRMQNPAQREQIRAGQRAQIGEQHADMAEVLDLDTATAQKLLDLLAAQQFETFERFYTNPQGWYTGSRMSDTGSLDRILQAQADEETRRLDGFRKLIGDERMDRYQSYSTTLAERGQVNQLDAGLTAANKLQPDQKEQLILLVQEQYAAEIGHLSQRRSFRAPLSVMPSREDMQRHAQLSTIESNEAIWRARKQSAGAFEQRAAQFLTAPQLSAFRQLNVKRSDELRNWILSARAQAGLDPAIPESAPPPPPDEAPLRSPLPGNVALEITLKVNGGEPIKVSHIGPNGQTAEFEIGDGLSVEATPTLFEDRWLEVQLHYLEENSNGKRRISGGSSFGSSQGGSGNQTMGTSVVRGSRKGYAITADVSVKQL